MFKQTIKTDECRKGVFEKFQVAQSHEGEGKYMSGGNI